MSFRNSRDVLTACHEVFNDAAQWCSDFGHSDVSPEFSLAARLAHEELTARALSFQSAIDEAGNDALGTFLQYEPTEVLHHAFKTLASKDPKNPGALLDAIADFYHVVFEGVCECETTASGTPAEALFGELAKATQAGISSLAWKLRAVI